MIKGVERNGMVYMSKCYLCGEPTKGKFCRGHRKLWERWQKEKREKKIREIQPEVSRYE